METGTDYTIAITAFWIGIIAAISLPLGALTSRFWIPEDRSVAGLMAFGGGALLAALTIDLVAPALEHGHFYELAAGAMIGGVIFVLLNEAVNDYGGFVRKVSTSIYHLRSKQHQRYRKVLSRLEDLDIFGEVEARDFRAVAAFIEIRKYSRNTYIYRQGDPSEGIYILASGSVSLLDPDRHMNLVQRVRPWETFSRLPFLTGAPNDDIAITVEESEVWLLPREKFLHLMISSPRLAQAIHSWLRSPETREYLVDRQQMAPDEADEWLDKAVNDLIRHATVPPVLEVERNEPRFMHQASGLRRVTLFENLPHGELDAVAERLVYKRHLKGEAFFHDGDVSDRLYIIDHGEVSLLAPRDHTRNRELLSDGCAFGVLAFITGARHSASAVASENSNYWVLLRRDLPELFKEAPILKSRFEHLLDSRDVTEYLKRRHDVDPDKVQRWTNRVKTDLSQASPLTPIIELTRGIEGHHGAALAIWLGILLDAIPESLVLGTIQAKASMSLSLIAGLFISNYPEALSSSIGMKHQGLGFGRVLLMWCSLVLITGLGAAMGALFFGNVSPAVFALIEGVAAGAMLTMIAQTMLPEAYFKGGNIVGLTTLAGFLTALLFKNIG
ncbi:MAG: cyclic nucleotide-binding domain-containing protein [Sedimenticola sp.]